MSEAVGEECDSRNFGATEATSEQRPERASPGEPAHSTEKLTSRTVDRAGRILTRLSS